jgi:hypothetical protein
MGLLVDFPVTLLEKAGVKSEKNAKIIVYSVITIAGIVIVYAVLMKIKSLFGGGNAYDSNTMNKELNDLTVNSGNLTITQDDATIIVNNLVVAMDWFGTDEQAIIDSLSECQTKDDLQLVVKTFGIKLYSGLGLAQNAIERLWSTPKDLQGWIRAEISGSSLQTVKDIFDNLGVPF